MHGQQVAGLPGVIEDPAAQVFGAAAAPHVEAVDGIASLKRSVRKTASVSRIARSFQAMHHKHLRNRISLRMLRMHQHLHAGFGFIELGRDRETALIGGPRPVVARDGQQVRVSEQGDKRFQTIILRDFQSRRVGLEKKEGGQRDRPRGGHKTLV